MEVEKIMQQLEQMAKVYVLTLVPIVVYGLLATYVFLPLLELGLYSMPGKAWEKAVNFL